MSEVNVPLLRKAVEWAETESQKPKELSEWYQGAWCSEPGKYSEFVENNAFYQKAEDCGTCYCIAGWVAAETQGKPISLGLFSGFVFVGGHSTHVSDIAARELGLDCQQANDLFKATNSIQDVRRIAEKIAGERL